MNKKNIVEAIVSESELVAKLTPLSETNIFDFMKNLRGGTYFNMGMYSSIPVSRAYKKTLRIYKVINMTAIVSGVSYENIGTTKDFRDQTGTAAGKAWYDHMSGYENKVGVKKSDPNSKYILWNVKAGSDTWYRFYLVDIDTEQVTPISRDDILNSSYITQTEKNKMQPTAPVGYNQTTGEFVENQTIWRTAAFEHIFWLSQAGKSAREYGTKFVESVESDKTSEQISEAAGNDLFRDAHANITTDLDAILSGEMDEAYKKHLEEAVTENTDLFRDAHAGVKTDLDSILSGEIEESKKLKESYRRTVSRGKSLVDNDLFVDFE